MEEQFGIATLVSVPFETLSGPGYPLRIAFLPPTGDNGQAVAEMSNSPYPRWFLAAAIVGIGVGVSADESIRDPAAPSPHEDDPKSTNLAVDALVDGDINWRGASFAVWAYPELEGANARYVAWQGRRKVPELIGLLDKPGSTRGSCPPDPSLDPGPGNRASR